MPGHSLRQTQMTATTNLFLWTANADDYPLKRSAATRRFTLDGEEELERHLNLTCQKVLTGVQKIVPAHKLEALVLGGGYGRGEGGVLKTENGDRSYNDLEFYVFLRGNRFWNERKFGSPLLKLGERLSPDAGLHVEFKVDSLARLRRSPVTMFSYDLVSKHRVLAGNDFPFKDCGHHLAADKIPLSEATRLLMNRCSGLLFAQEKLTSRHFTAEDADFVCRNIAKAQLAFGDSVLTVLGQYHWSCRERHIRLRQLIANDDLPWLPEACRHHGAGMEFKLHPHRTSASRATLQFQFGEATTFARQIWLWLESRRLGRRFESARDYALNGLNKCPETNPWRNCLINARVFGPSAVLGARFHRHPRELVLNALALLLWEDHWPDIELGGRKPVHWPFPTVKGTSLVDSYRAIWQKLN